MYPVVDPAVPVFCGGGPLQVMLPPSSRVVENWSHVGESCDTVCRGQ